MMVWILNPQQVKIYGSKGLLFRKKSLLKDVCETGVSHMGVSKNRGGPPKSWISIGFSIINHPFWGPTPIFGNTHMVSVSQHSDNMPPVFFGVSRHPMVTPLVGFFACQDAVVNTIGFPLVGGPAGSMEGASLCYLCCWTWIHFTKASFWKNQNLMYTHRCLSYKGHPKMFQLRCWTLMILVAPSSDFCSCQVVVIVRSLRIWEGWEVDGQCVVLTDLNEVLLPKIPQGMRCL